MFSLEIFFLTAHFFIDQEFPAGWSSWVSNFHLGNLAKGLNSLHASQLL